MDSPFIYISGNNVYVENGHEVRHLLKSLGFKFDWDRKVWSLPLERYNIDVARALARENVGASGILSPVIKGGWKLELEQNRVFYPYAKEVQVSEKDDTVVVVETPEIYQALLAELTEVEDNSPDNITTIAYYEERMKALKRILKELEPYLPFASSIVLNNIKRASSVSVGLHERGAYVRAFGGINPEEWDYIYGVFYLDENGEIYKIEIDKRVFEEKQPITVEPGKYILAKPLRKDDIGQIHVEVKTPIPILKRAIALIGREEPFLGTEIYLMVDEPPKCELCTKYTYILSKTGYVYAIGYAPWVIKRLDYLLQKHDNISKAVNQFIKEINDYKMKIYSEVFRRLNLEDFFEKYFKSWEFPDIMTYNHTINMITPVVFNIRASLFEPDGEPDIEKIVEKSVEEIKLYEKESLTFLRNLMKRLQKTIKN